jgi:hypothetical protein
MPGNQGGAMGKAIVLVLVMAFGGWWYFHAGRQMTEESIDEQYQVESHALANLDADYLCERMTGDYRQQGVSFTLAGTQREDFNKQQACDGMRESFRMFKRISALSNGALGLSFDNKVIEVALSPDRKTADVEAVATIRMGGRLLSKTHYVDRLVRRNGRILHASSQSKSWVYVPAGN